MGNIITVVRRILVSGRIVYRITYCVDMTGITVQGRSRRVNKGTVIVLAVGNTAVRVFVARY